MAKLLKTDDLEEIEKAAVEEAKDRYNTFLEVLFLIATSDREKSDKFKRINDEYKRLLDWNKSFSDRVLPSAYRKLSKDAYRKVKEEIKELTAAQKAEMGNLVDQLEEELETTAGVYRKKARKLTLSKELQRIREERLGYEDGRARQATSARDRRLRENLEFVDSKGRRIKSDVIIKLLVGDALWTAMQSSKASTWIATGHPFGIHRSVIDDRTTAICRYLDGKMRDLLTDDLPPLHKGCRSDIEIIVNK